MHFEKFRDSSSRAFNRRLMIRILVSSYFLLLWCELVFADNPHRASVDNMIGVWYAIKSPPISGFVLIVDSESKAEFFHVVAGGPLRKATASQIRNEKGDISIAFDDSANDIAKNLVIVGQANDAGIFVATVSTGSNSKMELVFYLERKSSLFRKLDELTQRMKRID